MNSEISLNEEFGKLIHDVVLKYQLRRIIEIGSWDGEGSTACFVEALKKLSADVKLVCIEIMQEKLDILRNRYTDTKFVLPICNSSISYDEMQVKNFESMWNSKYNELRTKYNHDIVREWFQRDIDTLKDVKIGALSTLIHEQWDGILIDGGEFTGYSEFSLIKNIPKVIFLDDVHGAYKCNQIYHELVEDVEWNLIHENPNIRNGYAIFAKHTI